MSSSPKHSPPRERIASEDPDTAATRKELRQTAISETPNLSTATTADSTPSSPNPDKSEADEASGREKTPDREASDESAREHMASPKKKRQHDEVDNGSDPQDAAGTSKAAGTATPASGEDSTPTTKSGGGEPERKRPRDIASGPKGEKADTVGTPSSFTSKISLANHAKTSHREPPRMMPSLLA
jgi:Ran-binding protein 3